MSSIVARHEAARLNCAIRERHPSLLARLWGALMREIRVHRDLRALSALDDASLRDIGLGRGGIEDAVRHGRHRRRDPIDYRRASCDAPEGTALPFSLTEWR